MSRLKLRLLHPPDWGKKGDDNVVVAKGFLSAGDNKMDPMSETLCSRDLVDGKVHGERVVVEAWQFGGRLACGFELNLPAGPCECSNLVPEALEAGLVVEVC